MKIKKFVSMISILCLLAVSLSGCGSSEITEVSESAPASMQENRTKQSQEQKKEQKMESPEMEIPEEDIAALLQAGLDTITEESDLWAISEITDTEVLMQLTQSRGGKERPEGEGGGVPEDMTPPDGEAGQRPDGEMPDGTMPNRDEENPPEDMEGTFPDGEMHEDGQGRGEGGRQSGNRGGRMASLSIVISGMENTTLEAEDIFAHIQLTAEELGYQASSMELTEEQQSVIEVPDGYSVKMVILINTQMPEMEAGEAVG